LKTNKIILSLILLVISINFVSAQMPPSEYWGYINEGNVEAGLEVLAWIDSNSDAVVDLSELYFSTNTLAGGLYDIIVPSDDTSTTETIEGGVPSDIIIVFVDGTIATPSLNWVSGSNDQIDLTIVTNNIPTIDYAYPEINPTISEIESQLFYVNVSDEDLDALSFEWLLDGAIVSTNENYTFTSNYNSEGTYNVTVIVSDSESLTSNEWILTVLNSNRAPVIETTPSLTINENELYVYDVDATDPDNDLINYLLSSNPTGMQINETTGVINWLTTSNDIGKHTINVIASDGNRFDFQEFNLTVIDVNEAPVINNFFPTNNPTIYENSNQYFNISATDPENNLLSYEWLVNGVTASTNNEYTHNTDFESEGQYNITVKVSDSEFTVSNEWTLTVTNVNRAPTLISPIPNTEFNEDSNQFLSLNNYFSDPDGDELTYEAVGNNQINILIDNNDETVTFTPQNNWFGQETITITAEDESGLKINDTLIVSVLAINDAPTISTIGDKNVFENNLLTFFVNASDIDNAELAYYANNLPTGATFENQIFSWTPNFNQNGTYSLTFIVNDSELTDQETINIQVSNFDSAPIINSFYPTNNPTINEDSEQYFNITASDPENDTLTYEWTLNGEIVSTNSDYKYSSNFESEGQYNITVKVSDSAHTTSKEWTLTVTNNNRAPILITPIPNLEFNEDSNNSLLLSTHFTDPDGDTLIYEFFGNNHVNIFIDENSQIAIFIPETNWFGEETITITAEDESGLKINDSLVVSVLAINDEPILDLIGDKTISENETLEFSVTANDVDNVELIYYANNLPTGASFENQIFTWTPNYAQEGEYQIEFVVNDSELTDQETINVQVIGSNNPPVIESFFPLTNPIINESEEQFFDIIAFDPNNDELTYEWFLDGELVSTTQNQSFSSNYNSADVYEITVIVSDGVFSAEHSWIFTILNVDLVENFDGNTTDFQNIPDPQNVTDVIIEDPAVGGIDFGDEELNLSNFVQNVSILDKAVIITNQMIGINTKLIPDFAGHEATITLQNIPSSYRIYRSEEFTTNPNQVGQPCPSNICYNQNYDSNTQTLTFTVAHFSVYRVGSYVIPKKEEVTTDPKADISISRIRLADEFVRAGDDLEVYASVKNVGKINAKDVVLTAIIRDLGIKEKVTKFNLKKGDKEFTNFIINIPEYTTPGFYYLRISAYGESSKAAKYIQFRVY
jgi:hypothetical protein